MYSAIWMKVNKENPSEISGSIIEIHENSPILDVDKEGEPLYSGSRWTKVLKSL